jgi:hypothetical protein
VRGPVVVLCSLAALAGAGCGASTATTQGDDGYLPVPDVTGLDVDQAMTSIRDGFLTPVLSGDARRRAACVVVRQSPTVDDWAVTDEKVTLDVDCSGAGDDGFEAGYREGFDAGCEQLFAETEEGTLYANDVGYGLDDCRRLRPDPAPRVDAVATAGGADETELGRRAGRRDGCRALFAEAGVNGFGAGSVTVTIDGCG